MPTTNPPTPFAPSSFAVVLLCLVEPLLWQRSSALCPRSRYPDLCRLFLAVPPSQPQDGLSSTFERLEWGWCVLCVHFCSAKERGSQQESCCLVVILCAALDYAPPPLAATGPLRAPPPHTRNRGLASPLSNCGTSDCTMLWQFGKLHGLPLLHHQPGARAVPRRNSHPWQRSPDGCHELHRLNVVQARHDL